MKKILSLALAAAMLVSAFTACGSSSSESSKDDSSKADSSSTDGGSSEEAPADPVQISLLMGEDSQSPYSDDWKILEYIKQSGGEFEIESVPVSDFETKKSLLINTGDIPDMITRSFATGDQAFSGMLMQIDEMEAGMPIYSAWLADNGIRDLIDDTRLSDGHYYTMPAYSYTINVKTQGWGVREDIFAANDIEIPTNLDEVYEAGLKLKEIYPDSTPISNRWGTNTIMAGIAGGFDTIAGHTLGDTTRYLKDENSYIFAPDSQNWKDMLTYMNKLYTDGVLDKEYSTLTSDDYVKKATQGGMYILFDYYGPFSGYNLDGKEVDENYSMIPINAVEGPAGYEGHYALQWGQPWTMGWLFASNIKDRPDYDQFLAVIDWFYTDEAETLLSFGTEGVEYTVENGIMGDIDVEAQDGLANNCLIARAHPDLLVNGLEEGLAAKMMGVYDFSAENNCVPTVAPGSPLSADQTEEFSVTVTNLTDYVRTMTEAFISGNESMDNYDAFLENCVTKGSTKLVDAYNEALAAK